MLSPNSIWASIRRFWADRPPESASGLAWPEVCIAGGEPTFKYRGWFINDEDLLSECYLDGGRREIDTRSTSMSSAAVVDANLRGPIAAAIESGDPGVVRRYPQPGRSLVEEAVRRGLFVSMHRRADGGERVCVPEYWRRRGGGAVLLCRQPEKFEAIWRDYAELHGPAMRW